MSLAQRIKEMPPAYFSMVMATGIIGIGFSLHGWPLLAKVFLFFNLAIFCTLIVANLYRLVRFYADIKADFHSYERGPGFLTIIAACCIVGNQFVLAGFNLVIAITFLVFAGIVWLFLAYGLFFSLTVAHHKKSLKDGINGGWLLFVVTLQAISGLTTLIAGGDENLIFISLCFFSLGALFYLYIMSLIIYRMSFFELHAAELGAPYWINMGATAITVLAGCMLMHFAGTLPIIAAIIPFLKGIVVLFWAAGTWWIPLLLLLGIWKHVIKKVKVPITAKGYDPSYWSLVFPIGMYSVSTFRLNEVLHISFLPVVSTCFCLLAVIAWCVVMIGFWAKLFTKPASAG